MNNLHLVRIGERSVIRGSPLSIHLFIRSFIWFLNDRIYMHVNFGWRCLLVSFQTNSLFFIDELSELVHIRAIN